ncbi:hypothetical protein EB093_09080, partial [bacterium]|nr:hypothetical protein [bacterium]
RTRCQSILFLRAAECLDSVFEIKLWKDIINSIITVLIVKCVGSGIGVRVVIINERESESEIWGVQIL